MNIQNTKISALVQNFPRYILICLSAGLTFISLQAGFHFYEALFGRTMAWTASLVFESLRFSTLYFILFQKGEQKALGWLLYVFIALTCSFAALSSFHARILENQQRELYERQKKYQPYVDMVKQRYVAKADSVKRIIDGDIRYCERKLAANPESEYWNNRRMQIMQRGREVDAQLDSVLTSSNSSDPATWLAKHSAQVGLSFTVEDDQSSLSPVGASIQQIIGFDEMQAKKLVAVIITGAVESGILLLALLSQSIHLGNIGKNNIWERLREYFPAHSIVRFQNSHQKYYATHHSLPNSRNLSKAHREIKRRIVEEGCSREQLDEFFSNGSLVGRHCMVKFAPRDAGIQEGK